MPLMVDVKRAVVFGGERGEGLQKTQKLAFFADELLVVPEGVLDASEIVLPPGRPSEVAEKLFLKTERRIPIHPVRAADADLDTLIAGATFVTSDLVDRNLNEKIAQIARRHHVLCNIIDTRDLCDTWFMSLVETDHLIAGLSTKAQATYYVTRLRKELEPKFQRWEREAAFTAEVRNLLPPQGRLAALQTIWNSPLVRWALRWRGPAAAVKVAQRTKGALFAGGNSRLDRKREAQKETRCEHSQ
jgi:siroheme synthase (precorrin-2 oxidase/ferrochelatase)